MWKLIVFVAIPLGVLIVFLVVKNLKDKKEFENKLKEDYRKPRNNEGDIQIDEKSS